ncbi:hypothetical protein ACFVUS_35535 [Nocardia sp. NPDC058058]|uniref:hypothetical protein n=1 Tax=Nocardia sp. NPDC058058 TaxID=3346317 RepID=UPI0036DEEAF7
MTETIAATALPDLRPATISKQIALLTVAQRRAMGPTLKQARAELTRRSWWEPATRQDRAVQLWGLGCLSTPTAVARWLTTGATRLADTRPDLLIACLEAGDRDSAWRAELAGQLAAGRAERWGGLPYFPLIVHLVRTSDAAVPDTDEFVRAWISSRTGHEHVAIPWRAAQLPGGENLLARLRVDPFLPTLARRAVELTGVVLANDADDPENSWPYALGVLSAEGIVDREALHTCTLNALLRGDGTPSDAVGRLSVLTALRAETAECASRITAYTELLVRGRSTAAAHAQSVLIALHAADLLPTAEVVALSDEVFARPEKKLVRAQLSWLERVVRAEPGFTSGAVRCWAAALPALEDATLRARIDKLIARYLPGADDETRMDLAAVPEPVLEPEVPLPIPPAPAVLDGVPASPAETAELYRWLSAQPWDDPLRGELVFDGLVRFTSSDRAALTEVLRPVLEAELSATDTTGRWWRSHGWGPLTTASIAVGLLRDRPRERSASNLLAERMIEWGDLVLAGAPLPPCALATPTFENGQIAAAELLDRLRSHRDAGIRPGAIEFAQALVRVAPDADPGIRTGAVDLGTPEGLRLAAALAGEPLTDLPGTLGMVHLGPDDAWSYLPIEPVEFPNPEVLARWQLWSTWRESEIPVRLAELPGPKDIAVHGHVMRALCADKAPERVAGVDALAALASTGQLRPELLVATLPGQLSLKRLAGSLRDAVLALGPHHAWPVIDALLTPLLVRDKTTGLADVLAVAADCARRHGATAHYPALVPLTERPGSGRLVTEARTLHAALQQHCRLDQGLRPTAQ